MNIFVLDEDPLRAARAQCDAHVVKMGMEGAQLLCSYFEDAPMKRTHYNHPCAQWARASQGNWDWLMAHTKALFTEYTYRYGNVHSLAKTLVWLRSERPSFPETAMTPFALVMPKGYIGDDGAVAAYRRYYSFEKRRFARYTRRAPPRWFVEARSQPPTLPFVRGKVSAIGVPVKIYADHALFHLCDNQVAGFPPLQRGFVRVDYTGIVHHPSWKLGSGYRRPLQELSTFARNDT